MPIIGQNSAFGKLKIKKVEYLSIFADYDTVSICSEIDSLAGISYYFWWTLLNKFTSEWCSSP